MEEHGEVSLLCLACCFWGATVTDSWAKTNTPTSNSIHKGKAKRWVSNHTPNFDTAEANLHLRESLEPYEDIWRVPAGTAWKCFVTALLLEGHLNFQLIPCAHSISSNWQHQPSCRNQCQLRPNQITALHTSRSTKAAPCAGNAASVGGSETVWVNTQPLSWWGSTWQAVHLRETPNVSPSYHMGYD